MVEPGETKVKAAVGEERKYLTKFNKKKHGKNNNVAKRADQEQDIPDYLRALHFLWPRMDLICT